MFETLHTKVEHNVDFYSTLMSNIYDLPSHWMQELHSAADKQIARKSTCLYKHWSIS